MSVFGMRDAAKRASTELPFDLPEEMAAAMRLMANPAAGAMAMSAVGLSIASHAFGLWAGTLTGAVQASQRLFAPLAPGGGMAAAATLPVAAPRREKPALKVVATSEPRSETQPVGVLREVVMPADDIVPAEPPVVAAQAKRVAAKVKTEPVAKDKAAPVSPPAKAASALQPEDFHKPRTIERPAAPDDLKVISGIGPKLEKVLNDLGVWTYAQIAAWKREEVAWVDDYLSFKGRIERDGWIEQARKLAAEAVAGK